MLFHKPLATSENKGNQFLFTLAVNGIAGGVAKSIVAPFERVKLLLQLQNASNQFTTDTQYKGIVNCLSRVYKQQGLSSLWRGNATNLFRYFSTQTLNVVFQDTYRKWFLNGIAKDDFWRFFLGNLACGGAAGATSLILVYPLDFARTRLAVDVGVGKNRMYTGLGNCVKSIYKLDGLKGLYRGMGMSLGGVVVYRAAFFGGYDTLKAFAIPDANTAPVWQKWALAQAVTIGATMMAYPFDTVSRRMMMQSGRSDVLYKSTLHCWGKILKEEGPMAFFKGGGINVVLATSGPIVLILYNELKNCI